MKLISLNVAIFEDNNKSVIKFLKDQNADFLCLQEVTRPLEKSVDKKFVSIKAIDSATSGLKYFFYGPTSIIDYFESKNFHGKEIFHFDFGGHLELGIYTKSKYEIIQGQSVFVENSLTYRTDFSTWPNEDYRTVLITDHDVKGRNLRILNYHGIWTQNKIGNERTLKANKIINDLALKSDGEVIICGDFNLFPDTPSMKIFEKNFVSLVDKFKIKTTRPSSNELSSLKRNVVDYVWVSKDVKVKNFEVVDSNVSDHLPLVLDFDL